jgi:hypothetical protein
VLKRASSGWVAWASGLGRSSRSGWGFDGCLLYEQGGQSTTALANGARQGAGGRKRVTHARRAAPKTVPHSRRGGMANGHVAGGWSGGALVAS